MKIQFGDIVLCRGEHDAEFPSISAFEAQPTIQTTKALRRPAIKNYNRQNVEVSFAFSVTREHDSHKAAAMFLIDHINACILAPIAVFTLTCELSGDNKAYSAANWSLERPRLVSLIGCATTISYSLKGGPFALVA
jgi:hypothetical protein